jgi:hypothetical protein
MLRVNNIFDLPAQSSYALTFGWLQFGHKLLLVGLHLPDLAHTVAANRSQ